MRQPFFRRAAQKLGYRLQTVHLCGFFSGMILIALLCFGIHLYTNVFRPALKQLGTAQASRIGQEVIHSAVEEIFGRDNLYDIQLMSLEKSEDGQIAAVFPNLFAINRLKSEIALLIQKKLTDVENAVVSIPLGNLTGIDLLSGFGPRLSVHLLPYGKALVDVESYFSDAGINQTRHQLLLSVSLELSLLLPDHQSCQTQLAATVPLTETVVVGSVPNSYTNLETEREQVKDDLLNLIE